MKVSREEYDKFVESSPQCSIYSASWWLDIVTEGNWDVAVFANDGGIIAAVPYSISKLAWGYTATLPNPHLYYSGILLRPCKGKYVTCLSEQMKQMAQVIDQLPDVDFLAFTFHHSLQNWLPFYWKGFQQTTKYTYIIRDLSEASVWAGLRENIRTDIRKAERQLTVCDDLGMDVFFSVLSASFERQQMQVPYKLPVLKRLDEACSQRQCRKMLFAKDAEGRIHAAVYVAWDDHSAYYLMGGGDPNLRNSGAHSLLLWEAIRHASGFVREFNFSGAMTQTLERFFRSFGGEQVPLIAVSRENGKYRRYLKLSGWWRKCRTFCGLAKS